ERLDGADHVAFFHFLTDGACKVRHVDSGEVREATAGDLILFPKEGRHLMGTDLQLAPMEREAAIEPIPGSAPEIFAMRHGGGGTSLVGEAPMQYLTRWRLALAAQTLRDGRDPISRIAEKSGYASEASFSRAFKREFGVPPANWRKARDSHGV